MRAAIAFCLCAAASTASCLSGKAAADPVPKTIRAVRAETVEIPDELSGFGSLSYERKTELTAPVEAVVGALPFREGDALSAGEAAVILENPQLRLAVSRADNALAQAAAALRLAEAREREGRYAAEARIRSLEKSEAEAAQGARELAEAERKHADQERLFSAGGIAGEAIRQSRFSLETNRERLALLRRSLEIERIGLRDADLIAAGYRVPKNEADRVAALIRLSTETLRAETAAAAAREDAAEKERESARLAAAELTVAAPASGIVGARYVEVGERVKRDDKLLTVISDDRLFAVFSVRETDALRLGKGMDAIVSVESAGEEFPGTVVLVSPTADERSASFSVRVALRDPARRLKPGMFARVTVRTGPPRKTLVLPESAFIEKREGQSSALALADGRLALRRVSIGPATARGREILSGAREGEVFAERPDAGLSEGDHVVVSQ